MAFATRHSHMREALLTNDWDEVGRSSRTPIRSDNSFRRNITTPQMDHLIETALANGAIAPKVCGAGGGGCIAFFCEDGRRSDVEKALSAEQGAEVLDWHVEPAGLVVKVA